MTEEVRGERVQHGERRRALVLEPAGENLYRLTIQGDADPPLEPFTVEPAERRDGEQLYRVTVGGQDVEGHLRRWSDRALKASVRPVRMNAWRAT